jgi:hypothetical protein
MEHGIKMVLSPGKSTIPAMHIFNRQEIHQNIGLVRPGPGAVP